MLFDCLEQACNETGFVPRHAWAALSVADRLNCIILFREPGAAVQGLIAEGHAMKGFRVDTKSCDWGPMSGFVCMDPRLTKDPVYETRNAGWTHEALSGEINEKFFGKMEDATWKGGVMPIVISPQRIEELTKKNTIAPTADMYGHRIGQSKAPKGTTILPWRLIPVGNRQHSSNFVNGRVVREEIPWLRGATPQHMVLCIDTEKTGGFGQQYPHGLAKAVPKTKFCGYETIMGLTNPDTEHLGFKACVTADYDLLAVWPGYRASGDLMSQQHLRNAALMDRFQSRNPTATGAGHLRTALPGNVHRMGTVDSRLQASGFKENHRFGDVSARIMNVKTLLNSAIQNPGGNAVHHNDEAGNVALAKGTLRDCLPSIGFIPSVLGTRTTPGQAHKTVLIRTIEDFKELLLFARDNQFSEVMKMAWYPELGLSQPRWQGMDDDQVPTFGVRRGF